MAVMLNMVVVDPKPVSVAKNLKNMGDKPDMDFAKKLDVATDKSDIDVDSKDQNDVNAQLMSAMAGLMAPMMINPVPTNQVTTIDVEKASPNEGQVAAVVPKQTEPQLSLVGPSVAGKDQEPVVFNTVLQAKEAQVAKQGVQVPVTSVVPDSIQVPVASAMASGVPVEQLANVVSVKTTSNEQLNTALTSHSDSTQNPLAAVVEKMTAVNPQVIDKQFAEVVKLQTQLQNQGQLQNQENSGQIKVAEVATKNTDALLANPVLTKSVPTAPITGNSNGLVKNNMKQIDGKKTVDNSVNMVAPEVDELGLVEEITVKPVVASQMTATVLDAMASESKEKLDTIVPNPVHKDSDIFATLLNQQGIKVQSQKVVEMSPASQPVADPYGISSQIVDQARLVAGAKNTEMIIQLKPEHLGELTFKVSVENGVVSASFHSNNSEVRNVIESSLYQLKQEMSNQGLKIDNVGVYAGLGEFFSNGQQSSRGNQQSGTKVQNKKTDEDFLEAFEATDSAGKVVSASGVDYRA